MKLSPRLVAATTALVLSGSAHAATLIPVTVPGSTSTSVFGINNNNVITGSWIDASSVEHGFCGPLAGTYATFDYSGNTAIGTEPRGINDGDQVVGFGPSDGTGNYIIGPEFEYSCGTQTMSTIEEGNTPLDGIAQGLDPKGLFVGDHWLSNGTTHTRLGYTGRNASWIQDFQVFGSPRVAGRGINKSGVIVGYYGDSSGAAHGCILQGGTATRIDFPDVTEFDTYLEGINDKGEITGDWDDGINEPQGFTYDMKTGTFTSISVLGSPGEQLFGINNAGLFAINTDTGAFIYCPLKQKQCPLSGQKVADGKMIRISPKTLAHSVLRPSSAKLGPWMEPLTSPGRISPWIALP